MAGVGQKLSSAPVCRLCALQCQNQVFGARLHVALQRLIDLLQLQAGFDPPGSIGNKPVPERAAITLPLRPGLAMAPTYVPTRQLDRKSTRLNSSH